MKNILAVTFLLFLILSCTSKNAPKEVIKIEKVKAEIPPADDFYYDTLQGMYIGEFSGSEIRIILNYVSQKNAIGYNIHKGLQRNLNGKVSRSNDSIQMILSEPGDNKYDGVFTIDFIGQDVNPTGVWVSGSGEFPDQKFKLRKIVAAKNVAEGEINLSNFAQYFDFVSDSIGDYHFKNDGLCIFEYYPNREDVNRVEQMVIVKGTWSLKDKTVKIDWQPNKVFPSNTMILEITSSEYEEITLKGENHEFWNHYYGP